MKVEQCSTLNGLSSPLLTLIGQCHYHPLISGLHVWQTCLTRPPSSHIMQDNALKSCLTWVSAVSDAHHVVASCAQVAPDYYHAVLLWSERVFHFAIQFKLKINILVYCNCQTTCEELCCLRINLCLNSINNSYRMRLCCRSWPLSRCDQKKRSNSQVVEISIIQCLNKWAKQTKMCCKTCVIRVSVTALYVK